MKVRAVWVAATGVGLFLGCGASPGPAAPRSSHVASSTVLAAPPTPSGSASASSIEPPHVPVPPAPVACVEPKTIVKHPLSELVAVLTADPLDDPDWMLADSAGTITRNDWSYWIALGSNPEITGIYKSTQAFVIPGWTPAGGGFDLALSPAGNVLRRDFTRGGGEYFDAKTGASLGYGSSQGAVSPDATYVVNPPFMTFATGFDHEDVQLQYFGAKPRVVSLANWSKIVSAGYDIYGAGVCSTSAIFAVSHPQALLTVYRAADATKLASLDAKQAGRPAFTKSGKWIVMRGDAGGVRSNMGLYELVP